MKIGLSFPLIFANITSATLSLYHSLFSLHAYRLFVFTRS